MQRLSYSFIAFGFAFVTAACGSEPGSSLIAPSPAVAAATSNPTPSEATGVPSLLGTWVSAVRLTTASTISLAVCSNIELLVASQTATQAAGTLSMDCPENIRVDGAITGQLGGATIPLTWNGTATQAGFRCPFSLSGTGAPVGGDMFQLTYSGSSCRGPVQGAETLRLASKNNPQPAPPPPVVPSPGVPTGWQACGSTPGYELVACVHSAVQPAHTPEGAFEVTKRVAWLLRGSGMGLLIKNGGENIVGWQGRSFSAARICLPDGHIFKILTDVPTTNGPSWQDNDYVNPSLYVPAIFPE